MPKWPFKRESLADVERDTELAEVGRGAYRRILAGSKGPVKLFGSEERARSLKARLRDDLDEAFTEEERMTVIEHYIQRLMHGGRKRHVAESSILRALQELQEES